MLHVVLTSILLQAISAGDMILGDSDGCVVVPATTVEAVIATASERSATEAAVLQAIDNGATTLDVYGAPPQ